MPDSQPLHSVAELLYHGLRTARYDIALLNVVLPGQALPEPAGGGSDLLNGAGLDRADCAVTGRLGEALVHVQALLVEVVNVLCVQFLGFLVRFRDADKL